MKEFVTTKIVVSGDIYEVYQYGNGYLKGAESPNNNGRRGSIEASDDPPEASNDSNRVSTMRRAQKAVRRLVNANVGQYGNQFTEKFLTLTFSDHVTEIDLANYELEKFIKRLNYDIFQSKRANLKYIAVPELTLKGRIHYHIILFNIPYVKADKLEKIWSNGFIKINKIKYNTGNVGAYIAKYMTKEIDWLRGKKSYLKSSGLFLPEEITDEKRAKALAQALPSSLETYSNTFANDHLGTVIYKQYNLKNIK